MRWTQEEYANYLTRSRQGNSQPQRPVCDESLGKDPGEETNPTRCAVRIVAFRHRLLDPDNLCPKYFIDSLRYFSVIINDSPDEIDLQISQEKVQSKDQERTEITITYPQALWDKITATNQ